MVWKDDTYTDNRGKPAYEKLDDDECGMWVSLTSTYVVEKVVKKEVLVTKDGVDVEDSDNEALSDKDFMANFTKKVVTTKEYELRPESEKPLYKKKENGEDDTTRLNRFGFKWTDKQVYEYYKDLMNFV